MGLDRRVANALWDAFFGRDVTAGCYRSLADVSAGTATRDLTTAAATGMLKAEGRRRGRRYPAGEKLFESVAAVFGIPVAGPAESARGRIVSELGKRLTR